MQLSLRFGRTSSRTRYRRAAGAIVVLSLAASQALASSDEPILLLRAATALVCESQDASLRQMAGAIGGVVGAEETPIVVRSRVIGWRRRFVSPDGAELRLERIAPRGQLRRVSAEYWRPFARHLRPQVAAVAGPDCIIRLGRRFVYERGAAQALEHLDAALAATGVQEPINPPVPVGKDPGGVLVAMVDAGVNYLLPQINTRLARGVDGKILGYDYWDLDDRPFDANPARSVFFPQRHGTRTASVVLKEAPRARLVPYRYPRPSMRRMTDLVGAAAADGVLIVNLSLGSNEIEDWQAFAAAAAARPDMLFIASAGNDGRDVDQRPVYPAALPLENMITVTSSESTGELARGSNRGHQSIDLLVPGENLMVTGFRGEPIRVSGSSYAAARITALAARLLGQHPEWHAPELKAAILGRVLTPVEGEAVHVARGFIPDPANAEERPFVARDTKLEAIEQPMLIIDAQDVNGVDDRRYTHTFHPTFAYFDNTRWSRPMLRSASTQAAKILGQCGVIISGINVRELRGPDVFRYFRNATAKVLVRRIPLPKPTVYFVRDTLERDAYDAEAIGKGNSTTRPSLMYTVWVTESIDDPGISLAHEFVHLLMDSGEHVDLPGNLMQARTSPDSVTLTGAQCEQIRSAGVQNGLLKIWR